MVNVECAKCGLLFSLTQNFCDRRHKDHKPFYCPNNHYNYWPQESDEEKLKKEKAALVRELQAEKNHKNFYKEEAKQQRRSAGAFKGQVTRIKNRIANGVCPCCNRSFTNVRRHMNSQHPEFVVPK